MRIVASCSREEGIFFPFFMAAIERAIVKLLVSRMTVLIVPRMMILLGSACMKILGVLVAEDGIEEEHAAEKEDLREEEKPHPHLLPRVIDMSRFRAQSVTSLLLHHKDRAPA